MKRNRLLLTLMVFWGLILSACEGIILPQVPNETPSGEEKYEYGQEASVDSLEVLLLESFPVQAQVILSGTLPDGCSELNDISVEQQGERFILTLTTRRLIGDVACTEALVPFEETVSLNIRGLKAGNYLVIAQDKQVTFILDVDNELSGEIGDTKYSYGSEATVELLQVNIMESFPVQVAVTLTGYLPDGCTEIFEINAPQDGNNFNINVVTRKPLGVGCTMAIVPFEETVSLDVKGLPAGDYFVQMGDLRETFTLDMDNELPIGENDTKYSYGNFAKVQSMQVTLTESFPVQVEVTLTGYLSDGCTKIYETNAEREGNTFIIHVLARKPIGMACTMAIVPFEETITLDVKGLPAGEYIVQYSNLIETFTLEQDNG